MSPSEHFRRSRDVPAENEGQSGVQRYSNFLLFGSRARGNVYNERATNANATRDDQKQKVALGTFPSVTRISRGERGAVGCSKVFLLSFAEYPSLPLKLKLKSVKMNACYIMVFGS